MRISNIILCCGIPWALGFTARGDELTLSGGGDHLSGSVRSITEDGLLELSSPLSPQPLLLKSGSVEKVEFAATSETPPAPALIELSNGDMLPGAIGELDDDKLCFESVAAGRLVIPRESLGSLQLGFGSRKSIYHGPRNLAEWTGRGKESKNWVFERGSLVASGTAVASREFKLPEKFILRFTLAWQARQTPNFKVCFADPLLEMGERCDRYFFQFNGAGLEIKRESTGDVRYPKSIFLLNRTPSQFSDRKLDVEIRVDRKGSRLALFLNGEPEGIRVDPVSRPPDAGGVSFACNTQSGVTQGVSDIEILEYDDSGVRHRMEERGDKNLDSLISRDDDRWGGRLLEVRKADEGMIFRFKSDFQNDPLEIPGKDVSMVFFAAKRDPAEEEQPRQYVVRLRGEGALRVTSCRFADDTLDVNHPLLGHLALKRDGIASIEKVLPKKDS